MDLQYTPIPAKYFLPLRYSVCDIFIRIKKGPDDFQYVKKFHSDDEFLRDDVEKYMSHGLKDLYIIKKFEKGFFTFLSNKIIYMLERSDYELDEQIKLMEEGFLIASEKFKTIGFTETSAKIVKSITKRMLETIKATSEMRPLITSIINNSSHYFYQNCHLTTLIGIEILKGLNVDDQEEYERLSFCAFFHDISLIENEDLARVKSQKDLEELNLSKDEIKKIQNHAKESEAILKKYPEIYFQTTEIIKGHHGSQLGVGFPKAFAIDIPRLSRVLIIAEAFSEKIIRIKEGKSKPTAIVPELMEEFDDIESRRLIKGLSKYKPTDKKPIRR